MFPDPKTLSHIFDFYHLEIKLSHETIVNFPKIFMCNLQKVKQRHEYLKYIGKDQYDPKKPNYVSPDALNFGRSLEFCQNVAKTTLDSFDDFIKTL